MKHQTYRKTHLLSSCLLITTVANAHSPDEVDHKQMDDVVVTIQQEEALQKRTSASSLSQAAVAVTGQEHIYGKWEGPYDWPIVAIHTTLLEDGKVLAWDSVGDGATTTFPDQTYTRVTLWDPVTNTHTSAVTSLGYNIFCSGHAKLSNGQLFIAGGNKNQKLEGLDTLTNYNPFLSADLSSQFSTVGAMFAARWYPAVTPLANGEMLVTGGGSRTPEVRQYDGTMRQLFNINENFAAGRIYNWLKAAPNGKVAYVGPGSELRYLDTNSGGAWQIVGERDGIQRGYGSPVSYGVGKILVTGGNTPAEATAVKIDLGTLVPSSTNNMSFARRQHNLTVLPNGHVLATGGFAGSAFSFDFSNAVYAAEVWNPATNVWTELADMQVHRGYHSTALLLPDGRVLSAGGGLCGGCLEGGYHQKNAEIFSPPYLFKKDGSGQLVARPNISAAPDSITPGTAFNVNTANTGNIAKVSLLRLGSATHSVNMEQNYISLAFTKATGVLNVTAPGSNNIATPGYYMLFLVTKSGVPSVAKILKVNGGGDITVPGQ